MNKSKIKPGQESIDSRLKERGKSIAASRGEQWRKNLVEGRLDSRLNPSNIQLMRLNRRLNQFDMAEKTDMSVSVYGSIERGRKGVDRKMAQLIASILKYPVSDLFDLDKKSSCYFASKRRVL